MSQGDKITYAKAWGMAQSVQIYLSAQCDRIEVAGSIRRHANWIGDIDLVMIPKMITDWTGIDKFGSERIENALREGGFRIITNGPLKKSATLPSAPDIKYEFHLTTPEKWGCIFTIATGSAEFAHMLVKKRCHHGWCPSNIDFKDGRLVRSGVEILNTPEEADVFRELGLPWVDPENR
jgi:DNA polymerase/3'-5' exonuclease PolX